MSKKLVLVSLLLNSLWSCGSQDSCTYNGDRHSRPGFCKELRECKEVLNNYKHHQVLPQFCAQHSRIVCCPELEVIQPRPVSNRISAKKCKEYSRLVNENGRDTCAFSAVQLIVGGEESKEREFPHMALIGYRSSKNDFEFLCGGSLISEMFILSASHCGYTELQHATQAKLGAVHRGETNSNTYLLNIQERIKHPQWKSNSIDHDIALFKLRRNAVLNSYVRPICLPQLDEQTNSAIATGWGQIGFGLGQSVSLRKVSLDIFNQTDCQSKFDRTGKTRNGIDYATKICAGSYRMSRDSCNGDSGGPLQIYNLDNVHCMYTILGITSYGNLNCGAIGLPGVYTRVFPYLDWIEGIVWPTTTPPKRTSANFVFHY